MNNQLLLPGLYLDTETGDVLELRTARSSSLYAVKYNPYSLYPDVVDVTLEMLERLVSTKDAARIVRESAVTAC